MNYEQLISDNNAKLEAADVYKWLMEWYNEENTRHLNISISYDALRFLSDYRIKFEPTDQFIHGVKTLIQIDRTELFDINEE